MHLYYHYIIVLIIIFHLIIGLPDYKQVTVIDGSGQIDTNQLIDSSGQSIDENNSNYEKYLQFKDQIIPYQLIHEPEHFQCNQQTILVLINSKIVDLSVRKSIRLHWSKMKQHKHINVRLIFIVGYDADNDIRLELIDESRTFADILSTSIIETYRNLTYKMYAAYNWISISCPQSILTIKLDSDVKVNVNQLIDYCRKIIKTRSTKAKIYGYTRQYLRPNRQIGHIHYVSTSAFNDRFYPTFCAGPLYILGQNVPQIIINIASKFNFISTEDVFFTGIIAESAQISLIHTDCLLSPFCEINHKCKRSAFIAVHGCRQYYYASIQCTNICYKVDNISS